MERATAKSDKDGDWLDINSKDVFTGHTDGNGEFTKGINMLVTTRTSDLFSASGSVQCSFIFCLVALPPLLM